MDLQQSWENARNHCKSLAPNNGGDLVSIHDTETNNYLGNLQTVPVQTVGTPWIGAFRQSSDPDDWAWTDGSAFDYSNWNANGGEPNNNNPDNPGYGLMLWGSWAWADEVGGYWKRFFCQQNK